MRRPANPSPAAAPGRPRARAPQQPSAADRRGGARQLDADGAGSGQAPGGGAGGAPVQGCKRASRARPGHCQGKRRQGETGLDRGASRGRALSRQCIRRRQDRGHRPDPPSAAIRRRWRCSADCRRTPSAPVKKAAADAIASIQSSLAIWTAVQNTWYGLSLGSVLLLAAIGLAITFGVMGVINMAHGEMVMLGAYTTYVVQEVIRAHNPALFDYSLAFAIPLAFLVAGLVGILIERGDHPLSLRPPAGDAARDLGAVADPPAGGAHRLRPDQQGRRQALLDERLVRSRRTSPSPTTAFGSSCSRC